MKIQYLQVSADCVISISQPAANTLQGNLPSQPSTIEGLTCVVEKRKRQFFREWNKSDSFDTENQKKWQWGHAEGHELDMIIVEELHICICLPIIIHGSFVSSAKVNSFHVFTKETWC